MRLFDIYLWYKASALFGSQDFKTSEGSRCVYVKPFCVGGERSYGRMRIIHVLATPKGAYCFYRKDHNGFSILLNHSAPHVRSFMFYLITCFFCMMRREVSSVCRLNLHNITNVN